MQAFVMPCAPSRPCSCSSRQPPAAVQLRPGGSRSSSSSSSSSSRVPQRTSSCAPVTVSRQVQARVRLSDLDPADQAEAEADGIAIAAQALQDYMQLEQSGDFNSVTIGNLRLKYGLRRGADGRLQLRRADGTWLMAKLDAEVAGIILLRSTADDKVFVLQTERFEQVDLSDDYLMLMMFADPAWQETLIPIQLTDRSGAVSQLEMSEQEFKDFVGLIKSLQAAADDTEDTGLSMDEDGTIDVTAEAAPGNGRR